VCTEFYFYVLSQDSVSMVTRLDWTIMRLKCGKGKRFLPFSKTLGPAVGSTQPPIQWVLGFFPGGKVARHEVDHYSSPSSAEIPSLLLCALMAWTGTMLP